MDNHGSRPEVLDAGKGRVGVSSRFSYTLNQRMLYVARKVELEEHPSVLIRASRPIPQLRATSAFLQKQVFVLVLAVFIVASAMAGFIAWRIHRPLNTLREGALAFAHGELDSPIPLQGAREVVHLTKVFNQMAVQLNETLRVMKEQAQEKDLIFSCMHEGVIALDAEGYILNMNQAAIELLMPESPVVKDRLVQEVIRHPDLLQFIDDVQKSRTPEQKEFVLLDRGELHISAHGYTLRDSNHKLKGILIVLSDITRYKQLEKIRSEFVANVSHELKTPLTTMITAIETLMSLDTLPDDADRFLTMLDKRSAKLKELIEDLLTLASIEQLESRREFDFQPIRLRELINLAVNALGQKAAEKKIKLTIDNPPEMTLSVNPTLMEQAVANLIDNTLNYSESGTTVTISASVRKDDNAIHVEDEGEGIKEEHQERIFERFYQVNKSGISPSGGSGLGLAIVKHIMIIHGGSMTVESKPGEGSTFTLHIPKVKSAN